MKTAKQKHAEYQRLWRAKNKDSVKESQRKYREKNRERRLEQKRQWYKTKKQDEEYMAQNAAKSREWRENNLLKVYLTKNAYYEKNKEKLAEYKHRWYLENTVSVRLRVMARNKKLQGVKIEKEQIENWDSKICGLCDNAIDGDFDIDHKTPLSRGGAHSVENLHLTHPTCNNKKYTKTVEEYKEFIKVIP